MLGHISPFLKNGLRHLTEDKAGTSDFKAGGISLIRPRATHVPGDTETETPGIILDGELELSKESVSIKYKQLFENRQTEKPLLISYKPMESVLVWLIKGLLSRPFNRSDEDGDDPANQDRNYVSREIVQGHVYITSTGEAVDWKADNPASGYEPSGEIAGDIPGIVSEILGLGLNEVACDRALEDYGMNSISRALAYSRISALHPEVMAEGILSANTLGDMIQAVYGVTGERTDPVDHRPCETTTHAQSNTVENISGAERKILKTAQGDFEYFVRGDGDAIVFLTAIAFTGGIWSSQIDVFSDDHKVIIPNFPAHGGSRFNGRPFSFEDLADNLATLLDELDIDSAHLVGWCMAGNVAQVFANKYQDRLKSLTLVCTTPTNIEARGVSADDLKAYAQESPILNYRLEFRNIYDALDSGEKSVTDRKQYVDKYLNTVRKHFSPIQDSATLFYLNELFKFNTTDTIGDISVPVLVIGGEKDIAFPIQQVKMLHKGITGSKMIYFRKSGHMPFLSETKKFNNALSEFIESMSEAGDAIKING